MGMSIDMHSFFLNWHKWAKVANSSQCTFSFFLSATDTNSPCSFISSCAANYLPAPFPVFYQQLRAMHRGGEVGRQRGEERRERERRGVFLSSDIVIKESPLLGWARLLAYSHPVWLPDTLAFTHTPVCTAKAGTDWQGKKDKEWETRRHCERDGRWDGTVKVNF